MQTGDWVEVTTERYSPWLGLTAVGQIAEAYDDLYVVEFDGDRLYLLNQDEIKGTNQ